jgi:hypothetical protein
VIGKWHYITREKVEWIALPKIFFCATISSPILLTEEEEME